MNPQLYLNLLKSSLLAEVPVSSLPPFEHFQQDAVTMIGRARLEQLHAAMDTVLSENVPGHFIETGVWRGGACIFMRGYLAALGAACAIPPVAQRVRYGWRVVNQKCVVTKTDDSQLFTHGRITKSFTLTATFVPFQIAQNDQM